MYRHITHVRLLWWLMMNKDGHVIYITDQLTQGFTDTWTYFNRNIHEILWFKSLYPWDRKFVHNWDLQFCKCILFWITSIVYVQVYV